MAANKGSEVHRLCPSTDAMEVDEEDEALVQVAINESIQAATTSSASEPKGSSGQSADEPAEPQVAPRVTIDDMIGKLRSRNFIEPPGFDDSEGDTWIFIDAAQRQPEQNQFDYECYVERCAAPFRMKKDTLAKLNSPVINSAFGPSAQYRILRRRRLVDRLAEGIKYVIDLTPPSEGEDAVWLISLLSCSEGVRLWHYSQQIWAVSSQLVGGEEDYTSANSNAPAKSDARRSSPCPEYSPIRHRAAIERLLAIAAGVDPKLDSATKVWTTFAVAKHLGIVYSPLTDYIVTWLRAYPNSIILEVLTESSHIMADQLQVYDLERDTFAMLVGEEALDSMCRSRNLQGSPSISTFGRKKDDLPENIRTRVEYASKKFTDRIFADFDELKQVDWIRSLPEFQRLSSYTQPELRDAVTIIKTSLEDWVQGSILHIQRGKYSVVPQPDITPREGGEDLIPNLDRLGVFNSLSPEERLLTRTFWNALETLDFYNGFSNLDVQSEWSTNAAMFPSWAEPDFSKDGYRRILRSALNDVIQAGQIQLDRLNASHRQPMEFGKVSTPSAPKSATSMAYMPVEEASKHPFLKDLALRQKTEQDTTPARYPDNLDPFLSSNFHVNGGNDATPSYLTDRPDSSALAGAAACSAKEKMPGEPVIQNILNANREWSPEYSRGIGLSCTEKSPDIAQIPDHELSNWADSLREKMSMNDDASDMTETSPLLKEKTDRSSDIATVLGDNQLPHNIHSTKRQAEPYRLDPTPLTTANYSSLFPQKPKSPPPPYRSEFFNLSKFFQQAKAYIESVTALKLTSPDELNERTEPYELRLINTLVCLEESEFKFLPLWAGGCDDDTGGVFNDDVAFPDVSFATAGPRIQHGAGMHTVSECDTVSFDGIPRGIATPSNSSVATSEYHLVNHRRRHNNNNNNTSTISSANTTINPCSNYTTAGYLSESLGSGKIYAADSLGDDGSSISGPGDDGDDFSLIARSEAGIVDDPHDDKDNEVEKATREVEAMERAEAEAAAEAARVAQRERTVPAEDENYADLFGSEEEDDDMEGDDMEDMEMEDGEESDDTVTDDDGK